MKYTNRMQPIYKVGKLSRMQLKTEPFTEEAKKREKENEKRKRERARLERAKRILRGLTGTAERTPNGEILLTIRQNKK